MKKLMFVATAALCATVFGAIESDNVVGYMTRALNANGYTSMAPAFINTGSTAMKMKDLTGNFQEGDSVQIFGNDGNVEAEIYWFVAGSIAPGATGWYTVGDEITAAGETVIDAGKEFWINTQGSATATIAGAVKKGDTPITLGPDYTATGNSTPIDRPLSAFTFEGLVEGDSVQIFGSDGNVETEIFWFVQGSIAPGSTGWYIVGDEIVPAGDTVIKAGTGFWVNRQGSDNGKITIPAALPAE